MNIGYMYILKCSDGSYYTGSTKNLNRRLRQHNRGVGCKHTSKRLPVKLVYYEIHEYIGYAFLREKQIQGWSRSKKEALIARNLNDLHDLANCKNDSHFRNLKSDK